MTNFCFTEQSWEKTDITERTLAFKRNENIPTLTSNRMNLDYGPKDSTKFLLHTISRLFVAYDLICGFGCLRSTPVVKQCSQTDTCK
jgi:hypothetical protein